MIQHTSFPSLAAPTAVSYNPCKYKNLLTLLSSCGIYSLRLPCPSRPPCYVRLTYISGLPSPRPSSLWRARWLPRPCNMGTLSHCSWNHLLTGLFFHQAVASQPNISYYIWHPCCVAHTGQLKTCSALSLNILPCV